MSFSLLLHLHSSFVKWTLKGSRSTLSGMQLPRNAIFYFIDFSTKRCFCFITPWCRQADFFLPPFSIFFFFSWCVFVDSGFQFRQVHVCKYVTFLSSTYLYGLVIRHQLFIPNPSGSLFKVCHLSFCPFLSSIRCQSVSCLLLHPTAGFIPPHPPSLVPSLLLGVFFGDSQLISL